MLILVPIHKKFLPYLFTFLTFISLLPLSANSQTLNFPQGNNSCFKNSFYDCSSCSCDLAEPIRTAFISILHFIFLILWLLIISCFYSFKDIRRHPGSMVFVIVVASFIYSLGALTTNIELLFNGSSGTDDIFCISFGHFNFATGCLQIFYQLAFFTFVTFATKDQTHFARSFTYAYHIVPSILTGIIMIILHSQDGLGRTVSGNCGLKTSTNNNSPVIEFGLLFGLTLLLRYILKRTLKGDYILTKKMVDTIYHYIKYLLLISLTYLVMGILSVTIATNIHDYIKDEDTTVAISLNIKETIMCLLRALTSFLVIIAWLKDPNSDQSVVIYLQQFWCLKHLGFTNTERSSFYNFEDFQEGSYMSNKELLSEVSMDSVQFENQVSITVDKDTHKEFKLDLVYSILLGVNFYWHAQKNNKLDSEEQSLYSSNSYKKKIKEAKKFVISTESLQREIPHALEKISRTDHKLQQGILTIHAPRIFQEIASLDNIGRFINLSLDVSNNLNKIIKSGINSEGKTTMFHFTSSDNKIIFQSVTKTELKTLLNLLPNYIMYLKSNQHSFLARTYGAFTYEVMKPYKKLFFVVTSNINKLPLFNLERTYELKGISRFRRTIMDTSIEKSDLKRCGILKDCDFDTFEKKIKIESDIRSKLLAFLRRDIDFLISQGLTDYSLYLYVVNREVLPSKLSIVLEAEEQLENSFAGRDSIWKRESIMTTNSIGFEISDSGKELNLCSIVESNEEDVDYIIGISDFLKGYGLKMRLEILMRRFGISSFNGSLIIEEPAEFGRKLMNYLEKIVKN